MTVLPAFPYMGQKGALAPWIVALAEAYEHDTYVEPFAGSAAVLLAKPRRGRVEIINDLDRRVVAFFAVVRDRPDALLAAVDATPHARREYLQAQDRSDDDQVDDLELARRFFVTITQSINRKSRKSGWSVRGVGETDRYTGRFHQVSQRLRCVLIDCRDALEFVGAHDSPQTCLYVDPPYLGDARGATGYWHEMPSADDHRELADVLHNCHGHVLLSGYDSPLYNDLYGDWHVGRQHVRKVTANSQRNRRAPVDEVIWSNRPILVQDDMFSPAAGYDPDTPEPPRRLVVPVPADGPGNGMLW